MIIIHLGSLSLARLPKTSHKKRTYSLTWISHSDFQVFSLKFAINESQKNFAKLIPYLKADKLITASFAYCFPYDVTETGPDGNPLTQSAQRIISNGFFADHVACGIIKALAFVESKVPSSRQLTPISPQRGALVGRPSPASRPPTRIPMFLATTSSSPIGTQSSRPPVISNSSSNAGTSQTLPLLPLPPPLSSGPTERHRSPSEINPSKHTSDQEENLIQVQPPRKRKQPAKS